MLHVLLSVVALAVCAGPVQDPGPPQPGTWILRIEGDAASLALAGAAHKGSRYRAPRGSAPSDWRVALVDRDGAVVADVPLDLSRCCMDRAHRGRGAHVRGDVVVAHQVVATVKVPARADAVALRIENVADPKTPVLLGSIDRDTLLAAVARTAKSDAAEAAKEPKKPEKPREEKKDR